MALFSPSLAAHSRQLISGLKYRVRREHPITDGLVGCWVFGVGNEPGSDLAGFNRLTRVGSPFMSSYQGNPCAVFNTTTAGFQNTDMRFPGRANLDRGLYVRAAMLPGQTPTDAANLATLHHNNGSGIPYVKIGMFRRTSATGAVDYAVDLAGYVASTRNGAIEPYAMRSLVVARQANPAGRRDYSRGFYLGANSSGSSTETAPTTYQFSIGNMIHASRNPQIAVSIVGLWNRQVTAGDAKLLDDEPYIIIEPEWDPFFVPTHYSVTAGGAEIEISGNGNVIADEDVTPIPGDRTHFGAIALNGGPRSHTFTIANAGSEELTFSSVEVPAGWSVETIPLSVAAASSEDIVFRLDSDTAGDKYGTVTFVTDGDLLPYNFAIQGTVYPAAPSPFTYPTFPAPGAVEDTQTISAVAYDFVDGGVYATGPTGPLLDTIYDFHFYWDNYTVTGGILYRIASPSNVAVKSTLRETFDGVSVLPDLINASRGWSQLALQEDAAPDGASAIALGNLVIVNGEGEFITNRVEPDSTRANGGAQSLRVYCQGATVTAPLTKASLASGLIHFADGDDIWIEFYVYLEDGTPLGVLDFECSYMLNSPGMRLLMNTSYVPRLQLKWGDNPDLDGSNPIPTDQWVKIRIHLGLSSATDGVVQMWVDDVLEIDGTMQTMPLPSAVYDRVQVGVTANDQAAAVLLYMDDLNIARSEAGLADLVISESEGGGVLFGALNGLHMNPRVKRYRRK